MLPITVLAVAVAVGATLGLGGSSREVGRVVLALAVGSIATLGPLLLQLGRESWGVGVLACGLARSLLVLGTVYLIETNTPGVEKRSLYLGAMVGAAKLQVAEAAVSAVDHCLHVLGGPSMRRDLPLERRFRDVRAVFFHPPTQDQGLALLGRLTLAAAERDAAGAAETGG